MKNIFSVHLVVLTLFIQTSFANAMPLFSAAPTMSSDEKRRLKKLDYYSTLAMIAWSTGEFDSYKKVPGAIVDFAVTDLACKGLCKYSGIKNKQWVVPFLPFVALGGKKIINYAITACKNGYVCKDDLQKRYGTLKWMPYFLVGIFVPYMMRKEITGKVFGVVDKKTGLTEIEYPQWVLNSTLLTLFAWQFHGAAVDWCEGLIQSAYDAVVPETKTQKYVRIKRSLARMASSS